MGKDLTLVAHHLSVKLLGSVFEQKLSANAEHEEPHLWQDKYIEQLLRIQFLVEKVLRYI